MRRLLIILGCLCLMVGIAAAGEPDDVEVLVGFTEDVCVVGFAADHGAEYIHTIPGINVHVYRTTGVERLAMLPEVEFVEVNGTYEAFTPDDPYWPQQVNLPQIAAVEGWQYSKGSPDTIIAILDTGIVEYHEDVNVAHHANFTDVGLYDVHGHGTHVAGIAAATTNNGLGIAGVDWHSSIMSVKVLDDDGVGTWSWISEGIVYAADSGADVINLSLGGYRTSEAMEKACDYAYENGVVVVAAAGNLSWWVAYPAAYDSVVAVGALNADDSRADFSGIGSELELMAPGVHIWSTYPGAYKQLSGTSMAAPHVAGLAGLIVSMTDTTPEQARAMMIQGADDLGTPGHNDEYGHGRINIYNTLKPAPLRDGVYIGGDVLAYYMWIQYAFGPTWLRDQIAAETTQAGFSNFHIIDNGRIASLRDILDSGLEDALRDFVPGDLEPEYTDIDGNPVYPPMW